MNDTNARTDGGRDVILSPDPTQLTRDSIDRDIAAMRGLLEARIDGESAVVVARLQAMDEAVRLVRIAFDRLPGEREAAITHLQQLFVERFNTVGEQFRGVDQRFDERDERIRQAAERDKVSIDAALAAQEKQANERSETIKDATNKSEAATTKLIDAQAVNSREVTIGLERQFGDLKERVTRIESAGLGRSSQTVDQRAGVTFAVGIALALVALLEFVLRFAR